MTSDKQNEANKQNAQASTGPKTPEGKAIVAQNAIKHGIFTKGLIISEGDGKENERDFRDLVRNLIDCLNPQDQMQSILVEKIAIDFWRLRRVLNYELACIKNFIDTAIADYYNPNTSFDSASHKTNEEIDCEITSIQETIREQHVFSQELKNGTVSFEKVNWQHGDVVINLDSYISSFYSINNLEVTGLMSVPRFTDETPYHEKMERIYTKNFSDTDIKRFILEKLDTEVLENQKQIKNLELMREKNCYAEKIATKIRNIPDDNSSEKVMRYENSLQKSITNNLALLKNLQAS